MQQSVDTSKLRRSTRIRQSSVAFSPEKEVKVQGEMGIARCGNNKRKQKALAVEEDQHQTHLAPSAGNPPNVCVSVCVCEMMFFSLSASS